MNLNELGFDYSNLNSCTITKKTFILPFVGLILFLCFAPILIIFVILYLLEVPMHFNGVLTYPNDPQYQQFFIIFLASFGGLSLLSLSFGLGFFIKPKLYMVIDKDSKNYEPFYYVNNARKHQILYITESFALIYNTKYHTLTEETNPKDVQELLYQFVFWNEFARIEKYKIKHKNKKTVLKYKSDSYGRFKTVFYKRYSFSNEIHVVPIKVSEMISYTSAGRNSIQAFNTFYFDNVNRSQSFEMHPEIRNKLHQMS